MKTNTKKIIKNNDDLLEQAKSVLDIEGIELRGTRFELDDELKAGNPDQPFGVQYATNHIGYEIVKEGDKHILVINQAFGIRLIDSAPTKGKGKKKVKVWLVLEAKYAIRYSLKEGKSMPSKDSLEVFANNNAPYNIWPFWREHAHGLMQKAGMNGFIMPLYFCPSK